MKRLRLRKNNYYRRFNYIENGEKKSTFIFKSYTFLTISPLTGKDGLVFITEDEDIIRRLIYLDIEEDYAIKATKLSDEFFIELTELGCLITPTALSMIIDNSRIEKGMKVMTNTESMRGDTLCTKISSEDNYYIYRVGVIGERLYLDGNDINLVDIANYMNLSRPILIGFVNPLHREQLYKFGFKDSGGLDMTLETIRD